MQDSCPAVSKCVAQTLVNITGDEAGTNAMLIISESSNSAEKNTSSKRNVSGFDQIGSQKRTESGHSINRVFRI